MSLGDFSFLKETIGGWLKISFKLGLLLNDVPVFHENRFEIRCGRIAGIVVTNCKISFVCFVVKSLVSVGELNFSQYFLNER